MTSTKRDFKINSKILNFPFGHPKESFVSFDSIGLIFTVFYDGN